MKISDAFPSNYLKASDLQDRNVIVKMDRVETESLGDDEKPVLYFIGKSKGMVLNKTNANNIAIVYGDDTTDWRDKEIVLFPAMVDFQGRTVQAIRVRAPQAKDRQRPTNGSQQRSVPRHGDPISSGPSARDEFASGLPDDEIPFAPEFR